MHVFKSADPAFLAALGLRQDERDNLRWWCDGPAARYLLGRVLRPRF